MIRITTVLIFRVVLLLPLICGTTSQENSIASPEKNATDYETTTPYEYTTVNNENATAFVESDFPHLPTKVPFKDQMASPRRTRKEDYQCYPNTSSNQPQFLIGYGSLMQKDSKDRTDPRTGESIPVRINGYNRIWNCKGESLGFGTTYLGVKSTRSRKAYFNGVVFKLNSAKSLKEYDRRESYYCREEVPLSKIHALAGEKIPANGKYWIYVTKPKYAKVPTKLYPIVQSYVDTFLSGCFEMEEKFKLEKFAEICVQTTKEFHSPWINDRIYPRRPSLHQPMAEKIDNLLQKIIPRALKHIQLEG